LNLGRHKNALGVVAFLGILTFVLVVIVASGAFLISYHTRLSTQDDVVSSSSSATSSIMESGYTYKDCAASNEVKGATVVVLLANSTQLQFSLCTYAVPAPPLGTYEKPGNGTLIDIKTGKVIFAENNASDLTVILQWGANTNCEKTLVPGCPPFLNSQLVRLPNFSSSATNSAGSIQYVVKLNNQSFTLEFNVYSPSVVSSSVPAAVAGT
jgi:hypothetical protein